MLSQTEENYIKAIYHLTNGKEQSATTNALSEALKTKPASVSDMLKKLSSKDLINYEKYKGVYLTKEGLKDALKIIRKHRLWEVFLVDKLNFAWDEVHDIAEQLEHIQSTTLTNKLDKFLGYPKNDPHGDPIPTAEGEISKHYQLTVTDLEPDNKAVVVGVKDSSASFLQYLNKIGISLGSELFVLEQIAYDQSLEIQLENNKQIISKEVAKNIYVSTH